MNVIADAGAIGSGIVGAKDGDVFALSEGDLQREGNQVRLRHMVLAQIAGRSRGVEIAQTGISQTVDAVKPGEHLLYEQLRFSVGVRGAQGVGFFGACDRAFRKAPRWRKTPI